jgi:hypothetical protein
LSRRLRDIGKEELMAKKRRPNAADELERQEKIKKLVIIAMFSDDILMGQWTPLSRPKKGFP